MKILAILFILLRQEIPVELIYSYTQNKPKLTTRKIVVDKVVVLYDTTVVQKLPKYTQTWYYKLDVKPVKRGTMIVYRLTWNTVAYSDGIKTITLTDKIKK